VWCAAAGGAPLWLPRLGAGGIEIDRHGGRSMGGGVPRCDLVWRAGRGGRQPAGVVPAVFSEFKLRRDWYTKRDLNPGSP